MNDWFCKAPYLTSEYSVNQSHMKRQDSLEMRDLLLIYSLEFEISEAAVREYLKIAKMAACSETFLF